MTSLLLLLTMMLDPLDRKNDFSSAYLRLIVVCVCVYLPSRNTQGVSTTPKSTAEDSNSNIM